MRKKSNYRSQRKSKGGLIHAYGKCETCGKEFHQKNAMAVAARHTDATGHRVSVEAAYYTEFYVGIDDDVPKNQQTFAYKKDAECNTDS